MNDDQIRLRTGNARGNIAIVKKKDYSEAAFLLHQAAERLYSGILIIFTHYKPNAHDLSILRKLANSVNGRLMPVFSLDNTEKKGCLS